MFNSKAEFLTLCPHKYPEFANVPETIFSAGERVFCAAMFYRKQLIPAGSTAHIQIFADTKFRLKVNDDIIGVGPVAAGGDFGNTKAMPKQYYNEYVVVITEPYIEILAEVQTPCEVMTDYSVGKGGFIFAADVECPDGNKIEIVSDESWLVRKDTRYDNIFESDYSRELPEWEKPTVVPKSEAPWKLAKADIPPLTEEVILPCDITKNGNKTHFDFPRIYSAYVCLEAENRSDVPQNVTITLGEVSVESDKREKVIVPKGKTIYRSFKMWSVGEVDVECDSSVDARIKLIYVHYPTDESKSGKFKCSDEKLNGIYELGRFTLEMCRQTLHLDSPLHQETLGCTGDYAIETLMTAATFGDLRLSRLDLIRTSDYLQMNGGVMFHTSYSLIFVTMLLDYYEYTADIKTVNELLPTVELLLNKFASYTENNVVENPPNYMFIEWGNYDGFNLHHPPKALGQTALNAFYQMALCAAAKLYDHSGDSKRAIEITERAELHRTACREKFFDSELGLFRDGTPAPESVYDEVEWLPANSEKAYHTRHANILSALCGFAENGGALIERVITRHEDFEDFDIQPYFMHYLMEAVRKFGLFGKYGIELIHLWDKQLEESPKGMKEGWGEFLGDCSHAWGATPTYQLPMAVSGFEMLKPGYCEFKLTPDLFSLDHVDMSLPTPHGLISIKGASGEAFKIDHPDCFAMNTVDEKCFVFSLK